MKFLVRGMTRRLPQSFILAIITSVLLIVLITACHPVPVTTGALPTLAQLPSATVPAPTATATLTASATLTVTPTATLTPSATITDTPEGTLTPPVIPIATTTTGALPTVPGPPTLTPTLLPEAFAFGKSIEGRDLMAYRYGTGSKIVLLVGGVHTGYETNTVGLLRELRDYYAAHPEEVLPGIELVLIPALNPDGLQFGEQLAGRFNAHSVDLNRNWGCDWSQDAVFKEMTVSPGDKPFSEPETIALGGFIQQVMPSVVLFYHGAANGVFPGSCGGGLSDSLAQIYSGATGYPYATGGGNGSGSAIGYAVTGSAPNWVDSLGIPSADIELASAEDTEFVRNRNGIRAVQEWALSLP